LTTIQCKQCGYDNPATAKFCGNCGLSLSVQAEIVVDIEKAEPLIAYGYMGFWVRFSAIIIDGIVLSVVSFVFYFIFMGPFIALLISFLYHWLFIGLKGQTLGKMVLGIKVIDENGDIPGLGKAAMREVVGKFVSAITLYIGFLWIAWDKKKQGLHDKIAETYVVKA
jgi:uncharacterized RDD family membrane protein YckC